MQVNLLIDWNQKMSDNVFCILPWTHMHIWPNGTTYPCCLATNDYIVGNTNQSTMEELWNSEKMTDLRKNILAGKPTSGCNNCYEHEKMGARSMRMNLNKDFKHLHDRTELTNEDGTLDEIYMAYMDIRFSNICNFKCRSCGPELSSFWVDDAIKLGRYKEDQPKILKIKNTLDELWEDVEEWIDTVERIYFAGGEPLIMDEHYKILEHLIKIGKTDIAIAYNTNFSKLTYKNKDVIELWKHFSNLTVGASLDAMGERGEHMRKGTDWAQIEKNRQRLLKELPDVKFYVSATISAYNAEHVPDFFDDWINKGYVKPDCIECNTVLFPDYIRAQILPEYKRQEIISKYQQFYDKHGLDNYGRGSSFTAFIDSLKTDKSELAPKFVEYNDRLDALRNESLVDTFPELECLYR